MKVTSLPAFAMVAAFAVAVTGAAAAQANNQSAPLSLSPGVTGRVVNGPLALAPVMVQALMSYGQDRSRSDQSEARRQMRAGAVKSVREIENMIVPRMRGAEYLGPSYDSTRRVYRLRFIRDGRVIYVDVDATTGRIIATSE